MNKNPLDHFPILFYNSLTSLEQIFLLGGSPLLSDHEGFAASMDHTENFFP